jgi:hypothetical protein
MPCDKVLRKGEEMGCFQHRSTLITFAPPDVAPCAGVRPGGVIRMGEPLLTLAGG